MNRKKIILIAAGAILTAAAITGCSQQLNDLGGVPQKHPDFTMTYLNVTGFPNVTMLCIDGAGFATTTRDNNAAIQPVPEWDAFCKTVTKTP